MEWRLTSWKIYFMLIPNDLRRLIAEFFDSTSSLRPFNVKVWRKLLIINHFPPIQLSKTASPIYREQHGKRVNQAKIGLKMRLFRENRLESSVLPCIGGL